MLKAIKENPQADRWNGSVGNFVFGIAVTSYSQDDVEKNRLQLRENFAHLAGTREMLLSKILFDLYAPEGMTNVSFLKTAILNISDELIVTAKIGYADDRKFISPKMIVSLAVAEKEAMQLFRNYAVHLHSLLSNNPMPK